MGRKDFEGYEVYGNYRKGKVKRKIGEMWVSDRNVFIGFVYWVVFRNY